MSVHDGGEPGGGKDGGREGQVIRLWDPDSPREVAELNGHVDQVTHLEFSPGSGTLATAGADCLIRLWYARTGAAARQLLPATPQAVAGTGGLAFSQDSRILMSSQMEGTDGLWDVPTGKELRCLVSVPGQATPTFACATHWY
ncbi:WD40 repeat domain-containing protein [Streptomyces sp. NPDC057336]|uniref:WD40 repeat domain-containing protein n=1 Tax=Streptomyces sp. NPDC057336 TaxID=3346102 RepID=UPI00363391C1